MDQVLLLVLIVALFAGLALLYTRIAEVRRALADQAPDERARRLLDREEALLGRERDVAALAAEHTATLERLSGLSREEAARELLARLDRELGEEQSRRVERALAVAAEEADRRAREVLLTAIQRVAIDHYAEVTLATIALPADAVKERLVGREGRNLRTFQELTGVDLLIDDTPGVVVLSSFDPVRREVARRALESLLTGGAHIHPARIEKAVADARGQIHDLANDIGRRAVQEAGLPDLHPDLVAHLGRLHFRLAHGQNALRHSLEVSQLAGALAAELGLEAAVARRAGLLHDLGRAAAPGETGPHPAAGAELAARAGEVPAVVNAIAAHHREAPAETPYAIVVEVANAICVDRPGERPELVDRHVRRLSKLEDLARSFPGVTSAFAVAAGRELRVLVNAEKVPEKQVAKLARDIAHKIEEEATYPGEVRVTVVRETRIVEHAK